MDPWTSFFAATAKFLDLELALFNSLTEADKTKVAERVQGDIDRVRIFLDKGFAHFGIGPLAAPKPPDPPK